MDGCLRSCVSINFARPHLQCADRSYIDNCRRALMRRSGSEEWQELLRHEEGRLEIEIHDLIPTFFGIFVNRRVNQGARIVDQYVQSFFALTDGFHQHSDASETGKIRRDRKSTRLNSSH